MLRLNKLIPRSISIIPLIIVSITLLRFHWYFCWQIYIMSCLKRQCSLLGVKTTPGLRWTMIVIFVLNIHRCINFLYNIWLPRFPSWKSFVFFAKTCYLSEQIFMRITFCISSNWKTFGKISVFRVPGRKQQTLPWRSINVSSNVGYTGFFWTTEKQQQ